MSITTQELASPIRAAREATGLTQEAVADAEGLSRPAVSQEAPSESSLLSGRSSPTASCASWPARGRWREGARGSRGGDGNRPRPPFDVSRVDGVGLEGEKALQRIAVDASVLTNFLILGGVGLLGLPGWISSCRRSHGGGASPRGGSVVAAENLRRTAQIIWRRGAGRVGDVRQPGRDGGCGVINPWSTPWPRLATVQSTKATSSVLKNAWAAFAIWRRRRTVTGARHV